MMLHESNFTFIRRARAIYKRPTQQRSEANAKPDQYTAQNQRKNLAPPPLPLQDAHAPG